MLTYSVSNAQTVGDHLNFIKERKPGGTFKRSDNSSVYFYNYVDERSMWCYVLDENLICISIIMTPKNNDDINDIIRALNNQNYIQIDDTHWKYYRGDGSILLVELIHTDDLGPVITIHQAN